MKQILASALIALFSLLVLSPSAYAAEAGHSGPAASGTAVIISTNLGDITVELDHEKAPISVENFLKYVDAGFYDGTIFHRVIPDFMIQGGGMTPDLKRKVPNAPIKNEAKNGLKNTRGSIAMARTPMVDSATSQFFINLKDNAFLDHGVRDYGYAVFGRVSGGMDVVDKIAAVKINSAGKQPNVPLEPVIIQSMKRKPAAAPAAEPKKQ